MIFRTVFVSGLCLLLASCGGGGGGGSSSSSGGGSGGGDSGGGAGGTTPTNNAPTFSSADAVSVAEGQAAAITIEVSDEDSDDTLSISISGDDAALFELGVCNTSRCTSNTLSFITAPDYETPEDTDADNTYTVIVTASDGTGSVSQTLSIVVSNVAPTFSNAAAVSVIEGQTTVMSVAAADPVSDSGSVLSYSLAGDDAALFALSDANQLSFLAAPDFENPADQDQNNTYQVTLTVTDGELATDQVLAISISDAFEGRVVDGPIAGAEVFVDLNGNLALDAGEPSGTSDSNGYFKVRMFLLAEGVSAKVISVGGVDASTGNALDNLTLISDVPNDTASPVIVTPLTTVVAAAETANEKNILLTALGVSGGLEEVLTTDAWATALTGDSGAAVTQRLNQQIGQIMLAANSIVGSNSSADSLQISLAVASELADQAWDDGVIDFTSTEALQTILVGALETASPDLEVSVQNVAAVASSLRELNLIIGDAGFDPTSSGAIEIAQVFQTDFTSAIENLVSGDTSAVVFASDNSASSLLADTAIVANSSDTDGDGVPDILDAFPSDPTETIDTDSDGIGNAQDPDDDGDGIYDSEDLFPLNFAEYQDTDGDGLGNNSDADDDGDGIADINDILPLSAANIIDTDGDGVSDLLDVRPNDAAITKAVEFNLGEVASLGLGETIDLRSQSASVSDRSSGLVFYQNLMAAFVEMLLPQAHANESLSNLTNAVSWDFSGNVVASSILSSETLFVAETATSPDGEFFYLLTSNHIQRALPNLDDEVCSIYRVQLANMLFKCLLNPVNGDIEPKSLIRTQVTDFARRGMAFRSDGAAVMQGFNWDAELPEGINGGTQSTTAWFMNKDGALTPIPQDFPYYAMAVFWITDEIFGVAEFAHAENLDDSQSQSRIAVYSANTLQRVNVIESGVSGLGSPLVRSGNDVYWRGKVLRGDSLLVEDIGGNGYPILDVAGERMLFLSEDRIFSDDGAIELNLVEEGVISSLGHFRQSGTGTDIKYSPIGFSSTHIAYRKLYRSAEPVAAIEGITYGNSITYELSNAQGTVETDGNRLKVRPDPNYSGDVTLDYSVLSSGGSLESRELTMSSQTISNWRADESLPAYHDYLEWASPWADREGFCVYEFSSALEKCADLSAYRALAFDMESIRYRYDGAAVYPDGSGNAYPGVQNTLLVGDHVRVFFKDSTDHQYYQAEARIADFMASGRDALKITAAINGAGDSNILSDAVDLAPLQPKPMSGITLEHLGADRVSLDFGRSLSSYGRLPSLNVSQRGKALQLGGLPDWSENRQTVTFSYSRRGVDASDDVSVSLTTPIFLSDQTRQYRPAKELSFRPDGINAFGVASTSAQLTTIDQMNDQTVSTAVDLITDGNALVIDARGVAISKTVLDDGIASGGGLAGYIAMPLGYVPVGRGYAEMSVVLTEQGDASATTIGRQLSASFLVKWSGDGVTASLGVPDQTVTGIYSPAGGVAIEFNVATAELNVLQISDIRGSEPSSLLLNLDSVLAKIESIARVPMISTGDYHIAVETDLPMADAANNPISKLEILVSIGS